MTNSERDHLARVAALGCIICRWLGFGESPAQVHHVRAGQGMAQRAGHYCAIPLCEPHHTGTHGVHGDKQCLLQLRCSEMDLLDMTLAELAK